MVCRCACGCVTLGKKELVALRKLSFCHCVVAGALCLFLAVPWVGLYYVVVAFPGHIHLLLGIIFKPVLFYLY